MIEQLFDLGLLLGEAGPKLLANRVAGQPRFVDLPYNGYVPPAVQSPAQPWGRLGLVLKPL